MKFFPIVPIRYLSKLAGLSKNHMVLAQWLTEKRYLNFYRKRRERGDFIILDNGACELGASLPLGELLGWVDELGGCDALVVPDADGTTVVSNLSLVKSSLDKLLNLKVMEAYPNLLLMVVPRTLEELEAMVKFEDVTYIGLNRDFEDYGRAKIIEQYKDCGKKFHLLGLRRNPIEEILAVKPFGDLILGVDSSFPYRLFSRGRRLEEYRPYPEHDSMYQKDLSDEILNFCISEFKALLEWINE